MAIQIKTPIPLLPTNYVPPGGMAYHVKDGDNWQTVANKLGIDAKGLISYNFRTNVPEEVNYYLKHNVGCTHSSDGKNFSFKGASPGIIFHPLIPPIESFEFVQMSDLTLANAVVNGAQGFSFLAHFKVTVRLNPKLPDPTRFEYRQFIKGRMRVRYGETWYPVPTVLPVSGGGTQSLSAVHFAEDGVVDRIGGQRWFYGRRLQPSVMRGKEIDYYFPLKAPPPQDGNIYCLGDEPGIKGEQVYRTHDSLSGVSVELHFRGDIVETLNPGGVTVWARKYWKFEKHLRITSRNPWISEPIPKPA